MSRGGPAPAAPVSRPPEAPAPAQPVVRVTNVRLPTQPPPPVEDERFFAEEGPAGGCASGECLPDEPPVPLAEPEPETESVRPFDVHHASRSAAPMAASGRDNPRRPLQERWRAAVDTVRTASGRHAKSLACGRLLWIREGEVALAYPPSQGFHKTTVSGSSGRPIVEKALSEHFGRPTKLVVQDCAEADKSAADVPGAPGTGLISIAEQDAQERAAYEKSAEGRVRSHPALRATLKYLGGEIEHIQVYEQPVRPVAAPTNDLPDESP
ncbi:DNA polymerase III subunit gamma/tau [Archangium violaceum]|uniref:DNA polymerase III subunit gamma/tau n=1 Tax=Archangium violaceum TaxID=83451 RepID=UPI00193AE991|nr:DNA polymerase III subunit gamma/tau [Archangium violaceum]QRK08500.1 DNA polymerase III subunit gamma/tau [Archangium violaceum]